MLIQQYKILFPHMYVLQFKELGLHQQTPDGDPRQGRAGQRHEHHVLVFHTLCPEQRHQMVLQMGLYPGIYAAY